MDQARSGDITGLLAQWRQGDREVEAKIVAAVYDELHRIARRYVRFERTGHSLQATALVNEAYVRLVAQRSSWKNRAHFFGVAATLMRRLLIDHARRDRAGKRGERMLHVTLDDTAVERSRHQALPSEHLENVIAVDEALTKLARVEPRQSRISGAAILRRHDLAGNRGSARHRRANRRSRMGRRPGLALCSYAAEGLRDRATERNERDT